MLTSGGMELGFVKVELAADVEDGGTLGCRASRDSVEASLLCRSELTSAFGDVQRNGRRGALQLVREITLGPPASARQHRWQSTARSARQQRPGATVG